MNPASAEPNFKSFATSATETPYAFVALSIAVQSPVFCNASRVSLPTAAASGLACTSRPLHAPSPLATGSVLDFLSAQRGLLASWPADSFPLSTISNGLGASSCHRQECTNRLGLQSQSKPATIAKDHIGLESTDPLAVRNACRIFSITARLLAAQ